MQGQLGNKICVSWGTEPTLLLSPLWEWHSSHAHISQGRSKLSGDT